MFIDDDSVMNGVAKKVFSFNMYCWRRMGGDETYFISLEVLKVLHHMMEYGNIIIHTRS